MARPAGRGGRPRAAGSTRSASEEFCAAHRRAVDARPRAARAPVDREVHRDARRCRGERAVAPPASRLVELLRAARRARRRGRSTSRRSRRRRARDPRALPAGRAPPPRRRRDRRAAPLRGGAGPRRRLPQRRASGSTACAPSAAPARAAPLGDTIAGVDADHRRRRHHRRALPPGPRARPGRAPASSTWRATPSSSATSRSSCSTRTWPAPTGPRRCARFFAEARLAASLRHPNIVAILDLDEDARRIVMELAAGGTHARGPARARPAPAAPRPRAPRPDPLRARAPRTGAASSTATSSRPTSCSAAIRTRPAARSCSATSASPTCPAPASAPRTEARRRPARQRDAVGTLAYMAPEQRRAATPSPAIGPLRRRRRAVTRC